MNLNTVLAMTAPLLQWLGTETLRARFGDFTFEDGYPVGDTAERLRDLRKLNLAVEVYLAQMMPVGDMATHEGLRRFGARTPQQVVIWEDFLDAETVLLTANTEAVYALAYLDLKKDGPTVVEAPPHMLGFLQDALQHDLIDIGPLGPDQARGGKFLVLPPGFAGNAHEGYFAARSSTYAVSLHGFQSFANIDQAIGLLKRITIYPLDRASSPPPMQFLTGSRHDIDIALPDNFHFFELLATLIEEEPLESFGPPGRYGIPALGMEKGKPFNPDEKTKALLAEAVRLGGMIARNNSFDAVARRRIAFPKPKLAALS
jgi:hypothetical protein